MTGIPVIDISRLQAGQEQRQAVAAEIRQACHQVGFFYIQNHGVPREATTAILAAAKRFFELPSERKNQVALAKSQISRGYEPIKTQTLDPTMQPDLKESFCVGSERDEADPLVQARTPNHGANQWLMDFPGWREQIEAYFATMTELSRQLTAGLALSLDLDPAYFDPMMDNPMPILRLLHYPPRPNDAQADEIGCGTHTDWGLLTILLQDAAGGLQVRTSQGDWVEAEPIPDTFVINLGDMMARWTNDYYQSTPHRVINQSNQDRYSVPFFWDINYHAIVSCLPSCQNPDHPSKYLPITAGEHIAAMYRQTYQRKNSIAVEH